MPIAFGSSRNHEGDTSREAAPLPARRHISSLPLAPAVTLIVQRTHTVRSLRMAFRTRIGVALAVLPTILAAQDRLPTMPGYAQFVRVAPVVQQVNQQIAAQRVSDVTWLADGSG